MEKSSTIFSLGGDYLILIRGNAPFKNEPETIFNQYTRSVVYCPFKKMALALVKTQFQFATA